MSTIVLSASGTTSGTWFKINKYRTPNLQFIIDSGTPTLILEASRDESNDPVTILTVTSSQLYRNLPVEVSLRIRQTTSGLSRAFLI